MIANPKRIYDTVAWRKLARAHRRSEPLCRLCGRPGRQVDHIQPIEKGGDAWDPANLQTLCDPCHGRKTRLEEQGKPWDGGADAAGNPRSTSHHWNR